MSTGSHLCANAEGINRNAWGIFWNVWRGLCTTDIILFLLTGCVFFFFLIFSTHSKGNCAQSQEMFYFFIHLPLLLFLQSTVSRTTINYWWYGSNAASLRMQHQNDNGKRQRRFSSVCTQEWQLTPIAPRPHFHLTNLQFPMQLRVKYIICRPGNNGHATKALGRSLRMQRGSRNTHDRWEGVHIFWFLTTERAPPLPVFGNHERSLLNSFYSRCSQVVSHWSLHSFLHSTWAPKSWRSTTSWTLMASAYPSV